MKEWFLCKTYLKNLRTVLLAKIILACVHLQALLGEPSVNEHF
jgi:hypothetical protein